MFTVFKIFKTKNVNQCKSFSKMSHFFQFICWSRKRDEASNQKWWKRLLQVKDCLKKKRWEKGNILNELKKYSPINDLFKGILPKKFFFWRVVPLKKLCKKVLYSMLNLFSIKSYPNLSTMKSPFVAREMRSWPLILNVAPIYGCYISIYEGNISHYKHLIYVYYAVLVGSANLNNLSGRMAGKQALENEIESESV